MVAARVDAYPWNSLPRLSRHGVRQARALRRAIDGIFDLTELPRVLRDLLHADIGLTLLSARAAEPPEDARLWTLDLRLRPSDIAIRLLLDPDLVSLAVGLALERRERGLGDPSASGDPELLGAAAALVVECARRTATGRGAFVLTRSPAPPAPGLLVEACAEIMGGSYAVLAQLSGKNPAPAGASSDVLLARLGRLKLPLALVSGLSLADRVELESLAPGDVWLPGGRGWIDRAALSAPLSRHGVTVEVTSQGKLVLLGQRVELGNDVEELGESMAEINQPADNPIREAVLEAPLVVRIELGTVSLSARDWAELRPGDVLETAQPIGQNVVLRIAGREVARGELVDVEGELGVRIQALTGEEVAP